MQIRKISAVVAMLGILASGTAQAELFDRGGGLLYDDVLNVTWLQDANYAKTSGFSQNGFISWNEAQNWASNLSFRGYSDWRLPALSPVVSIRDTYNTTVAASELSYMFYVNMGLKAALSPTGSFQSDYGAAGLGDAGFGTVNDVGLVKNFSSFIYWSGTELAPISSSSWLPTTVSVAAWALRYDGGISSYHKDSQLNAWAVRDGDVAAVPEPETYAMMLAGLGLMAGVARRRKQK